MSRRRLALIAIVVAATDLVPRLAIGQEASRPAGGVVLGGGSARGMAHAGVLQWLEEHRIPVDRIAGNSTGALMGAAYATGLSAKEIQTLLRDADWDAVLRPDIPYSAPVSPRIRCSAHSSPAAA